MPLYSIIIPVWNSPVIGAVCDALRQQTVGLDEVEILIVGSDRDRLVPRNEPFRFVENLVSNGGATERNLGMQLVRGEIVLFLDHDCIPAPDWLERHLEQHGRGEHVVGGAVALPTHNYLQLADNVSAYHDLLPFTNAGPRPYLSTANMSLRRSVIEQVGPMWDDMRRAEDLEWSVRIRDAGYQLFFEPSARVLHNPPRHSWRVVMRHWTTDAHDTLRVRLHYPQQLNTPRLARHRWMYSIAAPLVAAWATARTFSHPQARTAYWHTIPLVYLTKLAWCWGAFWHFPRLGGRTQHERACGDGGRGQLATERRDVGVPAFAEPTRSALPNDRR